MEGHHALSQLGFDAGPVLEMYFAPFDAWKRNLGVLAEGTWSQPKQQVEIRAAAGVLYNAPEQVQKLSDNIFRRVVEQHIELCRFFSKRWEQYLSLPSDITGCRSIADLAQLQFAFLSEMATDYSAEGSHFARTFQELASNWMAPPPASGRH
ncbi:MAG: hypothetical protein ACLPX9_18960 [Rhodomicrobium sp.]